jgi:hypothetical protein
MGAIVGGLASLCGVVATGLITIRLETKRRAANAQDEFTRSLRAQTAEVFRLIFLVEHHIHLVCWFAFHAPNKLTADYIDKYERRVQVEIPKLHSSLAVVAAMDLAVYKRLLVWVDRLDVLAGDVARLVHVERSPETLPQLADLLKPLQEYYRSLPVELGSILRLIGEPVRHHDAIAIAGRRLQRADE